MEAAPKLDAAGINNPSVLLIPIILTISGPADMVPHQTHLRIIFSGSKCKWTESITVNPSRTLLWLYWRLECNWICCKSTCLNLYRGWGDGPVWAWRGTHTKSSSFHQMWEQQVQVPLDPLPRGALGAFLCLLWYYATRNHQQCTCVYYSNHTAKYAMLSNLGHHSRHRSLEVEGGIVGAN